MRDGQWVLFEIDLTEHMHFSVKTIADLFIFGVENDIKLSFIGNNNQPVKRCIIDLAFKCIE